MSKSKQRPENVKDDGRVEDAVHVQLGEVLDGRNAALVEFEDVFLMG
jgi:hypothetical protein